MRNERSLCQRSGPDEIPHLETFQNQQWGFPEGIEQSQLVEGLDLRIDLPENE
ncbi:MULTISPECIES: hypothetical protein [Paenibacillus]|uniref:hypothetical protein n=1 Tax=Paenibacillus TaxID=44249 RepID=UPI0022B877D5|nr:hypothetical protein [Paenibacillus caseinilyticus]MCZ8522551.1 hypothetical protein [Paenibacillus caseinilyticus]